MLIILLLMLLMLILFDADVCKISVVESGIKSKILMADCS